MEFRGVFLRAVLVCVLSPITLADVSEVFTSSQVNVAEAGADSEGDAANEPSFAIDPTDLDRIAVGWRQFDSVDPGLFTNFMSFCPTPVRFAA